MRAYERGLNDRYYIHTNRGRAAVLQRTTNHALAYRPMKLFVYGIFLDEINRREFGMSNPRYAVVLGYKTISWYGSIVQAVPSENKDALTGMTVDVPLSAWKGIDELESGYDRIKILTVQGVSAFMYVRRKYEDER